jgi:hypothetical protein
MLGEQGFVFLFLHPICCFSWAGLGRLPITLGVPDVAAHYKKTSGGFYNQPHHSVAAMWGMWGLGGDRARRVMRSWRGPNHGEAFQGATMERAHSVFYFRLLIFPKQFMN